MHTIKITASDEELVEIYYAVNSKLKAVGNGHYGPDDNDVRIEEWRTHLIEAQAALAAALAKAGVAY